MLFKSAKFTGVMVFLATFNSACSESISLTKNFIVYMHGLSEVPEGATGNASADALTFTLNGIQLTEKDTGEVVDLYTDEPKVFTIIDRDQILFKQAITGLDSKTYTSGVIQVAADATIKSKFEAAHTADLGLASISTSQEFSCGKGQECTLRVYVLWKNIITRDDDEKTDALDIVPSFRVLANE